MRVPASQEFLRTLDKILCPVFDLFSPSIVVVCQPILEAEVMAFDSRCQELDGEEAHNKGSAKARPTEGGHS